MLSAKLAHLDPEKDPLHDFRNFLYHCFTDVLGFPQPDPIQYDIADFMQHGPKSLDGKTRQQIQAMRGCGKSVIAACYCCALWYYNPDIRILYLGSNQDLVDISAKLVKDLLDNSPVLEVLRPQDDDKYTMRRGRKVKQMSFATLQTNQFDVRGRKAGRDSSFCARPVFGGWTGRHPDLIIADDCEIPENSLTELKRKRLMAKLLECESLVLEEGKILYMGTPQTEDSIYIKLDAQGYAIRRWPAELPDPADAKASDKVSPWLLQRIAEGEEPGSPSYPERFPVEILWEKRAKSASYYALQMLLNPSLMDEARYPIKLANLIVHDVPCDMAPTNIVWGTAERLDYEHGGRRGDALFGPAWVEPTSILFQGKVMYIDPKGGGADSVGYAVVAHCNGLLYVLDAGGLAAGQSGTAEETMIALAKLAFDHDVKHIIVESNWGGSKDESTYARLLAPTMARYNGPVRIDVKHVTGQKEIRILDCLEPIVNHHRLVLCKRAALNMDLTHQLAHITRDRGSLEHDDVIDALYGACSHFAELVVLDPEVRDAERKDAAALAVAKEFDQWTAKNTRWGRQAPGQNQRSPSRLQRGRGRGWTRS